MFEFSPNVHGVAANLGRVCGTCNDMSKSAKHPFELGRLI